LPELHIRLLPVRPLSDEPSLALHLAVRDGGADRLDFRAEQLLDCALDVDLRGARRHLEHERAAAFAQQRRLLGDQRASDYIRLLHNVSLSGQFPMSCSQFPRSSSWELEGWMIGSCQRQSSDASSFWRASRVTITTSVSVTSRAVTRPLVTSDTPAMLRAD